MNFEKQIDELRHLLLNPGDNFIKDFENLISNLASTYNPEIIRPLLLLFDDEVLYDEPMFLIVHLIEEFDDEVYLKEVLNVIQDIQMKAPGWARVLLIRIINHDKSFELLRMRINDLSAPRKVSVKNLLRRIDSTNAARLSERIAILVSSMS